MNLSHLKAAHEFAQRNGVKAIIYGGAGGGKTPCINTAPRPLLLACEPGLLSMRGSKVPTYQAFEAKLVDEFFDWFFGSDEVKQFDTLAVDSISQMCEIYLDEARTGKSKSGNKLHGLAAYGKMAEDALRHINKLFFMPQKHMYLVAKQQIISSNGIDLRRPYYPGQQLPVDMPHKYDQILHLDIHNVPGMGQVPSFQCKPTIETMARDRTGQLSEFEEPNFSKIVRKVMM